ncbi:cell division control protein 42, partial [Podospora appendiculata]
VVVGDPGVDKTKTLITYTTGGLPAAYIPTVFDNYTVALMVDGKPFVLKLFDTAGQEDYDRLRPLSYPQTDVFLAFVTIGVQATYDNVAERWAPELAHHCPGVPIIIVGIMNSMDDDSRLAHVKLGDGKREGQKLVQKLGVAMYLECDIGTQEGLSEVFLSVR